MFFSFLFSVVDLEKMSPSKKHTHLTFGVCFFGGPMILVHLFIFVLICGGVDETYSLSNGCGNGNFLKSKYYWRYTYV